MTKKTEVASFRLTKEQKSMLKKLGSKGLDKEGSVSDGLSYLMELIDFSGQSMLQMSEQTKKFVALELRLKQYEQDKFFWGTPGAQDKLVQMRSSLESKRESFFKSQAHSWEKDLEDLA
jgi:hypothetical protein